MSVPLDRLYHYLADCVNHDLVIYRWNPPGSRKLEDLAMLESNYKDWHPIAVCHDQEPLDFDRYSQEDFEKAIKHYLANHWYYQNQRHLLHDSVVSYLATLGFRGLTIPTNQFDRTILVHSELNSHEVDRSVELGYVPVYYWSHGIIALDWFRYAQHDTRLQGKKIQQDFLVYNRAWSGTREYRLSFVEQILQHQLQLACRLSFNPEDDKHYSCHKFANPEFQITNFNIHDELPLNTHTAQASADYCSDDYASTGIEVVLETLFDDTRWHLTEKTLRPIACGQPFMLAATAGSLQYLRSYGFETFAQHINENYDTILDPVQRLQAIVKEIKRIHALPLSDKTLLFTELNKIAQRNQQHFFGKFFDIVKSEYVKNMQEAMLIMNQHSTGLNKFTLEQ